MRCTGFKKLIREGGKYIFEKNSQKIKIKNKNIKSQKKKKKKPDVKTHG